MMFSILNNAPGAPTKPGKESRTKKKWYRSPKLIRHGVMLFFFLFLVRVAYHHMVQGGGPKGTPSVEAYCPFGGIETLYQFLTTGGFIRRIEPSALILLIAVVVLTLVASRGFCGWICPFGSLQEWIGLLGRKILRKRYNPTGRWDRALRPLKYVVLLTIVGLTWWSGSLVFRDYDPFLAFFHLGQHMDELKWAYGILFVVLLGSLVIERFFCKYACPLGAVIGILGKAGITHIERAEADCKECNLCQEKCHAHVEFLSHKEIRSAECNHCLDCIVDCPRPNVLTVRGMRLRFSHGTYALALLAGFFGVVGISQLSGKWQTKPEAIVVTNQAGALDARTIRGWMTLKDVSEGFEIPLGEIYAGAGIDTAIPAETRVNEVGPGFQGGFSPEVLREFVGEYLQTHSQPAPAPAQAGAGASGESELRRQPDSRQPPQGKRRAGGSAENRLRAEGDELEVRGSMTLHEIVLKTGVPKEFLVERLGIGADVSGREPVRSWMHARGVSMRDMRQAVEDYRAGRRE